MSEARKRFFELRASVVNDHEPVIVTHKQGNIVMISMDEWESYHETLRLLNDTTALRALFQSFEERQSGTIHGKSVEDVFTDILS